MEMEIFFLERERKKKSAAVIAATAKVYLERSAENRSWLINDSTLLTITGLWWRFGVTHMYTQPPPQPQNRSSILGARSRKDGQVVGGWEFLYICSK